MTAFPYMVVFPGGNRKLLAVCYVRDYQEDDRALASRRRFENEVDAMEYCEELADEHRLRIGGKQYTLDKS